MGLVQQFSEYSTWRSTVAGTLNKLRNWLTENELSDGQGDQRLAQLLERLRVDKLTVAFVAEFSRGKSELINAIFFAEYGQRILPSSAGRTTMCPTELLFDETRPPSIDLLPIATRATNASIAEYRGYPEEWRSYPLETQSAEAMHDALCRVGEQKRVSREEAIHLGFAIDPGGQRGIKPHPDGSVDVPAWRHAVINFPHPLLRQGLIILDTPGLNAIGAEPELTLSLLPNAHAILFILAADTGVTQTDLAVWREHVNGSQGRDKGRIVVLNKIDGLWDGLRSSEEIESEIHRQVDVCAEILDLDAHRVFAVSAQKGLVAKVNKDGDLLARSRIPMLEEALSRELLPAKQEIVGDDARREAGEVVGRARELLQARWTGVHDQLNELAELRGKNQGVVEYMMRKVKMEKEDFERGLHQFYAVRSVFTTLSNRLFSHLGMDGLREETRHTREAMLQSSFSRGLREAMKGFFQRLNGRLGASSKEIGEIVSMLETMYRKFSVEHGLKLSEPTPFSMLRYEKELGRLESAFNKHVNTLLNIVTMEKRSLTQKFFETVAVQARRNFETANRDVEAWLRGVMAPLETQVREHQLHLKRRMESIKRINQATETLEDRIRELMQMEAQLNRQLADLKGFEAAIDGASRKLDEAAA